MCGRFTLRTPLHQLIEQLYLFDVQTPALTPRYNIAPSQEVATIRVRDPDQGREWANLSWGLLPSWVKDPATAKPLINARGETVAEKPSFRSAFRHRRCLILSDGYYEWKALETSGRKQAYYIHLRDARPFALAGLWEFWPGDASVGRGTCVIITTAANALTCDIHPRMPVILAPEDYADWLDPRTADRAALTSLLRPYDAAAMDAYPVSSLVNSPRHDSPDCMAPVHAPEAPTDAPQSRLDFT